MVDNSKICVVQFLELPYKNIRRYICVPNSWVKVRSSKDRRVYVAYPIEDPAKTKQRSDNNETHGKDWKRFMAIKLYESDDYDDAYFWIAMKNVDESTDDEINVIDDDYSTDNPDIAMKHNNASSGNGSSNTDTRGNQSESAMEAHSARHNTSIKPNGKPQMKVASDIYNQNIPIDLSTKRPLSPRSMTMFCKQQQSYDTIDRENKSINEALSHLNNPLEVSGKEILLPNYNNLLPRAQEMIRGKCTMMKDIGGKGSWVTNTNDKTVAMPTFLNQSLQSSENSHQQRIRVVSDDFLRYGYDKQRAVPGKFIENNNNDQRTHEMTPATQTLINIMKRHPQLSQSIHDSTSLNVYENYLHQEQRRLKMIDRPTEMNYIDQRTYLQNVTKNKSPAAEKSTNSTRLSRPISKRSQKKQYPPVFKDAFTQDSGTNNVSRLIDDGKPRHTSKMNAAPFGVKKISDVTNQFGNSHEEKCSPAYNILVQQDSQVRKIIITRSTDGDSNDQSMTQSTSYAEQNFLNIANQLSQMNEHSSEKDFPLVLDEHIIQQNPCANTVVRNTAENPVNLSIASRYDVTSDSSTQYFPRIENRFNQLSKASNEIYASADSHNDVRQVTRTPRLLARESTAATYNNKKPGLRGVMQNTPSTVTNLSNFTNQSHQISDNSYQRIPIPVLKGYMFHDPRTTPIQGRKAAKVKDDNQRPSVECINHNVSPTEPTIPISAHQIDQCCYHSYNKQESLDCRDIELPNMHTQRMSQLEPYQMHGGNQKAYQSTPQNIPSVVENLSNSSTHSNSSCQYSLRRQFSLVTPSHSFQEPLIQGTCISRSPEGNYDRQSIYYENKTEQQSVAKQNPTNLATFQQLPTQDQSSYLRSNVENRRSAQHYPHLANQLFKHSTDKHSPKSIDCSNKAISTEKKPVNEFIDTNSIGQSSYLENDLKDKSMASRSSSNVINGSENAREILINNLKLLFLKLDSSLSVQFKALNDIRYANIEFNESLQKLMDEITTYCKSRINDALVSKTENEANMRCKQKIRKEFSKHSYDINDNHDDIYEDEDQHDDNRDEYYKPPKKMVRHKRLFDLPSEYNLNNQDGH